MPTIELISIDCPIVPDLPRYASFAYSVESVLDSHRGLFQSVFDSLSGVIVHLGNKELEGKEDGFWFAGMLMDWQYDEKLFFLPNTRQDIADLMQRLIMLSPRKRMIFSTDYQFGGLHQECGDVTLSEFFKLHDEQKLNYNSLWYIYPDA
jgi:hypothetical protein